MELVCIDALFVLRVHSVSKVVKPDRVYFDRTVSYAHHLDIRAANLGSIERRPGYELRSSYAMWRKRLMDMAGSVLAEGSRFLRFVI